MKQNSDDEQALIKVQHDLAEAPIKGDSSYTRRLEAENCTVVWPYGSIVNKRQDLKSMGGDREKKSSWREIGLDGYIYETARRMEGGRITNNSSLKEIIVNDRRYSL